MLIDFLRKLGVFNIETSLFYWDNVEETRLWVSNESFNAVQMQESRTIYSDVDPLATKIYYSHPNPIIFDVVKIAFLLSHDAHFRLHERCRLFSIFALRPNVHLISSRFYSHDCSIDWKEIPNRKSYDILIDFD